MNRRVWLGIFFLAFGLGFLFQQMGVLDFSRVLSTWWPLILIMIGVIQLFNRMKGSGVLFIIVGGLFLVNQWVDANLSDYIWPLILITIGLVFIFSRINHEKPLNSDQSIQTFSLFSGTEIRSQSNCFEGGTATAIFGGSEIDLREAVISEEGATLDLTTLFGGISVAVPENVKVEVTGLPIFGGWENKTRPPANDDEFLPVLKVKCLTMFGGVEISD